MRNCPECGDEQLLVLGGALLNVFWCPGCGRKDRDLRPVWYGLGVGLLIGIMTALYWWPRWG